MAAANIKRKFRVMGITIVDRPAPTPEGAARPGLNINLVPVIELAAGAVPPPPTPTPEGQFTLSLDDADGAASAFFRGNQTVTITIEDAGA